MDAYDLQARHAPVVLTILPLVLIAVLLVPEFSASPILPATFGSAVVVAIYALLARYARARGRKIESQFFEVWGGMPTTAMLRHRDDRLNPHTKARFHLALRNLGPSFIIPTAEDESVDQAEADRLYASAMDEVRRRAKAKKYTGVRRENISYGFCRNMLALRPVALAINLFCLAGFCWIKWRASEGQFANLKEADILGVGVMAIAAMIWIFIIRTSLVQVHAEAYARELFETIDPVAPPS
ncbi:hypothetical protein [Thalassobaculum litoreum]|uniref:Uncharacterized protein n=1 Tax=Thalassobaculum litoreum DSM 18839 TaxID=1123362 RepID=A0A8G2BKF7_9PROT|nr:hypothetical protein [Thalassobaculum litoreum]SDG21895.1 hypothetical protein SAMN05660686_03719 [Thalassobaculum litoreum DSM 18839]